MSLFGCPNVKNTILEMEKKISLNNITLFSKVQKKKLRDLCECATAYYVQ